MQPWLKNFLLQTTIQLSIITLIWVLVARDASKLRVKNGLAPSGISPFAWGALCGLTFIAIIPYALLRKRATNAAAPARERNLFTLWLALSIATGLWAASEAANHSANNAAQHALLTAIFISCAIIAFYRDRRLVL